MTEQAALDILTPVLEAAVYIAASYCKECGRKTVTAKDIEYGMKYSARNVTGKYNRSFLPESDDESDDESDFEVVDDDDEPFSRYEGDSIDCNQINECFDTWDDWDPTSLAEIALKNAIDKRGE